MDVFSLDICLYQSIWGNNMLNVTCLDSFAGHFINAARRQRKKFTSRTLSWMIFHKVDPFLCNQRAGQDAEPPEAARFSLPVGR